MRAIFFLILQAHQKYILCAPLAMPVLNKPDASPSEELRVATMALPHSNCELFKELPNLPLPPFYLQPPNTYVRADTIPKLPSSASDSQWPSTNTLTAIGLVVTLLGLSLLAWEHKPLRSFLNKAGNVLTTRTHAGWARIEAWRRWAGCKCSQLRGVLRRRGGAESVCELQ